MRLLECLAGEEHLEMKTLAALLKPPADGPWYRAGRSGGGSCGPELLAAPLALFCTARRGLDRDFLAAAATSLARLTHEAPQAIATAVLAALVVSDLFQAEGTVEASIEKGIAAAQRWGGATPDVSAVRALASRLVEPLPLIAPELRRVVGRFF